jgi:hypothetical protein
MVPTLPKKSRPYSGIPFFEVRHLKAGEGASSMSYRQKSSLVQTIGWRIHHISDVIGRKSFCTD